MDYKKMAAAFAAGGAVLAAGAAYSMKQKNKQSDLQFHTGGGRHAYLQDTSLASLAAAAYLIRDYNFDGKNIHIFDQNPQFGGECGYGTEEGALLLADTYMHEKGFDCCWELFRSIPSLNRKGASLKGEIVGFNRMHPIHCNEPFWQQGHDTAHQKIVPDRRERRLLEKLLLSKDEKLEKISIQAWFGEESRFFETDFWIRLRSLFSVKESTSVKELRSLLLCQGHRIEHMDTMEDWLQLPSHPYESLIRPLLSYLKGYGVQFHSGMTVEDAAFADTYNLRVRALTVSDGQKRHVIELNADDLCILTLGAGCHSATYGSMEKPCGHSVKDDLLWNALAAKRSELNVAGRMLQPQEGAQGTFLLSSRSQLFCKMMEQMTGNIAGSGGTITIPDSNWGISICIPAQMYLNDGQENSYVMWGTITYPFEKGDYVRKSFDECSGREILTELIEHLALQDHAEEIVSDCIQITPCLLPYGYSAKLAESERVLSSPKLGSGNFTVISPYRSSLAKAPLEQKVSEGKRAVRLLMEQNDEDERSKPVSWTDVLQSVRLLHRLF